MPELARFYGIIVRMHFVDHAPPHFHALYQGANAAIDIERLVVLDGWIPARALGLVNEWASLHQEELRQAWERRERGQPVGSIDPLP